MQLVHGDGRAFFEVPGGYSDVASYGTVFARWPLIHPEFICGGA